MGLIKLASTNPKLSFLIYKNPQRGLIAKPNRHGVFYCYYPLDTTTGQPDSQQYLVYFRDNFNQVSYKSSPNCRFDYLDILRYTSPEIPLHVLRECFRTSYATLHQSDTTEFQHTFTIFAVKIDCSLAGLNRFTRYFGQFGIHYQHLVAKVYRVEISTGATLYHLLNFVNIFCTFIAVQNNDYFVACELQLENQLRSINILRGAYFIRYLLASKMITSKMVFEHLKPSIRHLIVLFRFFDHLLLN